MGPVLRTSCSLPSPRVRNMSKRRRTDSGFVPVSRSKRPIDKLLVVVDQSLNTTQVATVLTTITFPCTITGLRWNLGFRGTAAGGSRGAWAIVVVRDGITVPVLGLSDGGDLYTPEQDVLSFGFWSLADSDGGTGDSTFHVEGNTKSMRKMMGGDTLQFISKENDNNGAVLLGCVQLFCKV